MSHTILLVDDEPNVLEGLQRHLRRLGCAIQVATSGEEALGLLEKTSVDIVISDQDMPGMSGAELLRTVHRKYPDTVRFMLTGKATLDVAVDAINNGGIGQFFMKPCSAAEISASVQRFLREKDLIEEARQLLVRTKQQSSLLADLERRHPGITHVDRDDHGVISLDDIPVDPDELIVECRRQRGGNAG